MRFLPIIVLGMTLPGINKLQVFLSKRENKWLGLILPMIGVLFSIMILINEPVIEGLSVLERNLLSIMILFVYNIPTIVLVAIYFGCREKSKKKKQIDEMNITNSE
jgi:uncharacterized membrane protein HdeD (DUF308 family)